MWYNYSMIYLDHAAATPMSEAAIQAMLPYLRSDFYNPSAPYLPAKHVREIYEAAKNRIAHAVGAKGVDLVMTAGATESINLAFTACKHRALVLATEHHAVINVAEQYNSTYLQVNRDGVIDLADFKRQLTDEVDFVSIALANNEIGTIQPMAEIAEIMRTVRQDRLRRGVTTPLYLYSDASQAVNLIDINAARLGVDLLTINAAKCGGPKAVGALYVAHGIQLQPVVMGGGQEKGLRSGTENVAGVVAFAEAITEAKAHLQSNRKKYQTLAKIMRQGLKKGSSELNREDHWTPKSPSHTPHPSIIAQIGKKVNSKSAEAAIKLADSRGTGSIPSEQNQSEASEPHDSTAPLFLGNPKHQLASFIPVCFPGIDAERLVYKLESRGVLVSTGAACAANKGTKSHVLAAIGLSDPEIAGSLRISLGSTNTAENVYEAANIIREEVEHEYRRLEGNIHG